ncbi:MAG: class I SAM-dependent methyltransferase [Deltaproteobacteria bacterium]|nr:MAG: class I SAM-dependent methyltransferase [Deltaproteobacteria bacterium]
MKKTTIRHDTTKRHQHKYKNPNPIHQWILGRFFDRNVEAIHELSAVETVLDFGCGEGLALQELKKRGVLFPSYVGVDLRRDAIEEAQATHPDVSFVCEDIFEWPEPGASYDLVMASQVLEHLPEPGRFMERLVELSHRYLLLTVPYEPWFRLMNLARGRDLLRLGNHPEHINHWGASSFRAFVGKYATVQKCVVSFPFLLIVAEVPSS